MKKIFKTNREYFGWFDKTKEKVDIEKVDIKKNILMVEYIKKDGETHENK